MVAKKYQEVSPQDRLIRFRLEAFMKAVISMKDGYYPKTVTKGTLNYLFGENEVEMDADEFIEICVEAGLGSFDDGWFTFNESWVKFLENPNREKISKIL